ncbi:MAG: Small GTP-binding domain protein [Promethearchaeota archaeon]|nr:MAG: Small GTP-binding domain protein [Candidatus Lokiarchaeota archaeon]
MKDLQLEDTRIKLAVWDIAGQERWFNMRHKYYRGAKGALIVGDLTREDTFQQIKEFWYNDLQKYFNSIPIILIGNKNDLDSIISLEKIKKLEKTIGAETTILTSAKTGKNVEKAFGLLSKKIIETNIKRD